jgi:iron complex outermembrane receptor protein
MIYRLSDEWTSQTVLSRSTSKAKGYYSYLYEGSQYLPNYPNAGVTLARYISDQNSTTSTIDIQQNFNGDFKIGNMRNRIVVGLDHFSRVTIDNGSGYAGVGSVNLRLGEVDNTLTPLPNFVLSKQLVDTEIAKLPLYPSNTEQKTYSAYASDVINFLPNLSAMLSLRVDRFENGGLTAAPDSKYAQTAFSPKFGLVYQPILDKVSIYANYMNGYTNVAPVRTTLGQTITFKPEHANQFEGGVKVNIFENKLAATVSYYDIRVADKVRMLAPNQYVQDGENYSRGFEFDLNANPIPGLNIVAGYSHNNSKVTRSDATDYLGRRPEEAGPRNMVNAWVSYRIEQGKAKGLGFGFGGNYASENAILNRTTTGTFTLPAYTVLNASVFYSVQSWSLNFKMDNLTNKQYYKGWSTLEAQQPRAFIASVAFKF